MLAGALVELLTEREEEKETRGARSTDVALACEKVIGVREREEWRLAPLSWCLAAEERVAGDGMWKV